MISRAASTAPRLTWLALAGNPCMRPAPARVGLPKVRTHFKVKSKKQLKAEAAKPTEDGAEAPAEASDEAAKE